MSQFRLALAFPSGPMVHTDFAMCLAMLCLQIQKVQVPGYKGQGLVILNKRTSLLPKGRQGLVEDAITSGSTHILFVDTDQTFPAYTAHQLASHQKRVVACNIATKSVPASPTARKWEGGGMKVHYTRPESKGLEQTWRVGTGVMLIKLDIFENMPKPWFPIRWEESMAEYVGEDWGFCEQVEAAGHKIYIDHDLSKEIGHIGNLTYTHDLVGEIVREEIPQESLILTP